MSNQPSYVFKCTYINYLKEKKMHFYLLGHDYMCALNNAMTYLDNTVCEDCWNILNIKPMPKIYLVNASIAGEDEDQPEEVKFVKVVCPNCKAENSVPIGMANPKCHRCHKEIAINPDSEDEE